MPKGQGTYGSTKGRPPKKPVKKQMWSSPLELYPVHVSSLAPTTMAYVIEPQTKEIKAEYLVVQPTQKPYEMQQDYSRRVWVCQQNQLLQMRPFPL